MPRTFRHWIWACLLIARFFLFLIIRVVGEADWEGAARCQPCSGLSEGWNVRVVVASLTFPIISISERWWEESWELRASFYTIVSSAEYSPAIPLIIMGELQHLSGNNLKSSGVGLARNQSTWSLRVFRWITHMSELPSTLLGERLLFQILRAVPFRHILASHLLSIGEWVAIYGCFFFACTIHKLWFDTLIPRIFLRPPHNAIDTTRSIAKAYWTDDELRTRTETKDIRKISKSSYHW